MKINLLVDNKSMIDKKNQQINDENEKIWQYGLGGVLCCNSVLEIRS